MKRMKKNTQKSTQHNIRKTAAVSAVLLALFISTVTGCGRAPSPAPEDTPAADAVIDRTDADPVPDTDTDVNEDSVSPSPDTKNNITLRHTPDSIIIGGKVKSIAQESFVISRVQTEESPNDGSDVITLETGGSDEELVTICCTENTVFCHWTINGGEIEMNDAVISDIRTGSVLEAEGKFDGETFIADTVIIEVYE